MAVVFSKKYKRAPVTQSAKTELSLLNRVSSVMGLPTGLYSEKWGGSSGHGGTVPHATFEGGGGRRKSLITQVMTHCPRPQGGRAHN